jgi:molecular chaperone GrpE
VSEDKNQEKTGTVPEGAVPEVRGPEEEEAKAEPAQAEPEAEPEADPKAELEAQVADLADRFARSVAELENYRRRAEREREDVAKYAISNFARDMLAIADSLGLALASISAEVRAEDKNLDNLAAGVELTERGLMAAFERHGCTKIDPMGERFNHDLHQAMFEIEDTDKPPGTIVEVMQPGYVLKDRLLRPAMVGVTKGGTAQTGAAQTGAAQTGAVPEGGGGAPAAPAAGPGKDDAKKPPKDPKQVDTKA